MGKGFKKYGIRILILLILWQLISMLVKMPLIPSVDQIVLSIFDIDDLAIHIFYSLKRVLLGIFLALSVGLPLGIIMGSSEQGEKLLQPYLYLTYPVPKMAFLPLVMLLFGLGDTAKILMVFLITVFPVVVNVRDEIKKIPEDTYIPIYSLGASKHVVLREIILPSILPGVLTALRVCSGTALSVLFFAENFGTTYGIGYVIMDAWMRVNYSEMYGGIFVMSCIGLILFVLIDLIEKKCVSWR